MARAISKILFILGSYNVLAYLECIRSYAWSKDHSEPDLGSVKRHGSQTLQQTSFLKKLRLVKRPFRTRSKQCVLLIRYLIKFSIHKLCLIYVMSLQLLSICDLFLQSYVHQSKHNYYLVHLYFLLLENISNWQTSNKVRYKINHFGSYVHLKLPH